MSETAKEKIAIRDIYDKSGNILLRKGSKVILNEETSKKFIALGVLNEVFECDEKTEVEKNKNPDNTFIKDLIFSKKEKEPAWKKYDNYLTSDTSVKNKNIEGKTSMKLAIDGIEDLTKKFIYEQRIVDEKKIIQASKIIENLIFYSKSTDWFSFFKIIENYEAWLYTHSINIALLSSIIAQDLHYNYKMQKDLCLGALFSNIGKVLIPKAILNKTECSQVEIDMIENHCEMGFAMIKNATMPEISKMIVLQHHELLNGYGYPNSLVKSDILEQSQIVCIADEIDTITTNGIPNSENDTMENVLDSMINMPNVYNEKFVGILKAYLFNPFK